MDLLQNNRSWYLIYSKPRSEEKARLHLEEQGFETYLPQCRVGKIRNNKKIEVVEALFPNYLFIRLDAKLDNWSPIRSTPGVNKLVRFGLKPATVPSQFIDELRSNEDERGLQVIVSEKLKSGDRVKVLEGSLNGLEAVYLTTKGSDRAMIMLNILGQISQVELPASRIAAI